ncbi:hypothetical protein GMORB2_4666 [Geosmithia morbida]|uniref:EDC4-like protein pdc1 beta-propeller domain-containing protein n=1 Tax=Geosmithia morbida TaxID=1094350 RepID=A0A9P5D0K3_9HYPO|nr:uncharacterized protein GMORB2_4666 [Geosmithia morbida]KAF4119536.1 hypothetical protein GMORB2_4666 [Geosmithia morbida]
MDHLPPAPTPPVNNGNISNMASSNQDRTANLLNLLKFNSGGGGAPQPQRQHPLAIQQTASQQQPQQQQQQQQVPSQPPSGQQSPRDQHPAQQHMSPTQLYEQPTQSHHHELSSPQSQQFAAPIHAPAPAAADPTGLLAALMRGAHDSSSPAPQPHQHQTQASEHHEVQPAVSQPAPEPHQNAFRSDSPPPDETKSFLLNLLNRPKPGQNEQSLMTESSTRSSNDTPQSPDGTSQLLSHPSRPSDAYAAAREYQAKMHRSSGGQSGYDPTGYEQSGYGQSGYDQQQPQPPYAYPASGQQHQHQQQQPQQHQHQQQPQQPQQQADINALYQQLIGNLTTQQSPSHSVAATKDHQASPAGSTHSAVVSPHDLQRQRLDRTSSLHSHQSQTVSHPAAAKQTPPSDDFDRYAAPEAPKESVSDAISDIASKVDRDARQALERAESEMTQAELAEELDQRLNADSDTEFTHARALRNDVDSHDDNVNIFDDPIPDEAVETAHEIVEAAHDAVDDAAAQEGVADSWESADQDDIVVIEEPPVKVFNFPMKPWISMTLKEGTTDPRPEFRDEAIMDIARLKKEFDQMDRNLYTASPNYMTYGMSKQGGLRVIRQDDGKDAKVFTDTKDRIFNVAMSVTPNDYTGVYREAIIGTGISGTVYWVQIRDGDKDHIEDAHLEQCGFALPPMGSSEGDTPGGVLKTRARASTSHPEFFAVGRGKTINVVWPSYVMQSDLFRPGHDRVVDVDRLSRQCSLKINTGKAGKDFAFSQDDTVIVSLDKSGRVKFWDARDLTAAKEDGDPRHPMPAHSSLEVKEPLMTLSSTPEGDRAWPTSVLLLDKQRPYQKRSALRYMIVGMKQNHTLQLWDLALGKPVQEFNLPHSKESDAVCSVMYHASSGMIVIGHPTRNSIYFAHLSAPKYNLKSVSQAEYMQRLVAQDTSIPQPDSTAVISGVREYSFENRGILRSLDMLSNPAMIQDTDEPTLFELYAMHSKGVACVLVKQRELGWSKDNKVLSAVDAVTEGVITVSKLKSPEATPIPAGPVSAIESSQPPTSRVGAARPAAVAKDSSPPSAQLSESAPMSRAKSEARDTEPQSSKENAPEKPERRSRKKKAAAAATAGGNQADAATNGNGNGKSDKTVSADALDAVVSGMETRLGTSLADTFKASLKNLHGKIDDGAKAREDSFNQHQLKLLDMVSSVLNDNTQKVLEALVHQQFTDLVIPAIGDKAASAVNDVVRNKLQPHVSSTVHKEIQASLPHALGRSLRSDDFVGNLSDRVVAAVNRDLLASLTPALASMASQSARQASQELRQQYNDQFERLSAQRAADSAKIDQLNSCVQQLTGMMSTMAASQSSMHAELVKLRKSPVHELPGVPGQSQAQPPYQQQYAPMAAPQQGPMTAAGKPQPGSHQGSYGASQSQGYLGSPSQYERGSQGSAAVPQPQPQPQPQQQQQQQQQQQFHPTQQHRQPIPGAYGNQAPVGEPEMDEDLLQRIRAIEQAIQDGHLQDAMIQWIQSGREEDIFRRSLSRYPPAKFEALPPLMLLVVIATISKNIRPNPRLKEEVDWIEMAIRAFCSDIASHVGSSPPPILSTYVSARQTSSSSSVLTCEKEWDKQNREVARSTSQTMSMLIGRVRLLIDGMQDGFPTDPFLAKVDRAKLEWIVQMADNILTSFGVMAH